MAWGDLSTRELYSGRGQFDTSYLTVGQCQRCISPDPNPYRRICGQIVDVLGTALCRRRITRRDDSVFDVCHIRVIRAGTIDTAPRHLREREGKVEIRVTQVRQEEVNEYIVLARTNWLKIRRRHRLQSEIDTTIHFECDRIGQRRLVNAADLVVHINRIVDIRIRACAHRHRLLPEQQSSE
jgi:hypothetical protein